MAPLQNPSIYITVCALMLMLSLSFSTTSFLDAKLLSRQRFYEDPYATGMGSYGPMATGQRALITVRGARNPYDGSAPAKLAIEHDSYRGPYPARGVYDRLDMQRPMGGYPMGGYPLASSYGGGYPM